MLLTCLLSCVLAGAGVPAPTPVLGDYDSEPRTADGHVDVDRLVRRLTDLGANTYFWLVWHSPHDWADLGLFLPRAKAAGIQVWVYLVPPSETAVQDPRWPYSEPFRLDYERWGREIGQLSLRHDNLVGWVIDDFWANLRPDRFTEDSIKAFVAAGKAVNPKLRFYPLMYFRELGIPFVERLAPLVDGVVAAYPQDAAEVERALTFLEDRWHIPAHLGVSHPWNRASQPGDHGALSRLTRVTDATKARLRFRHIDDFEGATEGYHRLQVRVDDQVVWEQDVAGRHDGEADIDLSAVVAGKTDVRLSLGVWDAKGVANFGVQVRFEAVTATGLEPAGADPNAWTAAASGGFTAAAEAERRGQQRFRLPLIVMPAGVAYEHKLRHPEAPTPENIAARVAMAVDLARAGTVQGVVIYCLPKGDDDPVFEAVRRVYQAPR